MVPTSQVTPVRGEAWAEPHGFVAKHHGAAGKCDCHQLNRWAVQADSKVWHDLTGSTCGAGPQSPFRAQEEWPWETLPISPSGFCLSMGAGRCVGQQSALRRLCRDGWAPSLTPLKESGCLVDGGQGEALKRWYLRDTVCRRCQRRRYRTGLPVNNFQHTALCATIGTNHTV